MPQKNGTRKSHSFFQGALILSFGAILVKVIGAIFKIPLTNLIGELGMGYFNTAYQIYLPVYTVATAGFPIAVARMVAQNMAQKRYRDVRQIYKIAAPLFVLSGLAGTLVMLLGARPYVNAIHSPHAVYCIWAMAPTVFFCCVLSVQRGYYEGLRNMVPTAVSQVIEALCKLFVGLLCAYLVMKKGMEEFYQSGAVFGVAASSQEEALNLTLPFAAAGAIVGVTVGAALGFLYLWLRHRIKGDGITEQEIVFAPVPASGKQLLRTLMKISVPVCLGALVVNLGALIDVTFLQSRLAAIAPDVLRGIFADAIPPALGNDELTSYLYGSYTLAQNVSMLVPTVAQALGVSALPTITEAWTGGNRKTIQNSIESVVKISALIAFPAGFGLFAMSGEILTLLFAQRPNGVVIATPLLMVLAVTVIFMTLSVPVNSMLQAVGRVDLPVKLLAVGMVIKLAMNYTLVAVPEINLQGACYGSAACYLLIAVLGIYALCKQAKIKLHATAVLLKPALAGALCGAAAKGSYVLFSKAASPSVSTLLAVGVAVCVYIAALFITRTLSRQDIQMLPKGDKLLRLLEKRRWIR